MGFYVMVIGVAFVIFSLVLLANSDHAGKGFNRLVLPFMFFGGAFSVIGFVLWLAGV